jgi:hypothetical protein
VEALSFQLINFGYHAGLAVLVGGGLALGLAAAPALFRTLPSRSEAGTAFGEILARWDGIAVAAAVLVVCTAFLRALNFETPDARHWVRWALLAVVVGATLYASAWAGPVARQLRQQLPAFDDLPSGAPARREFARLHAGARAGMSIAVAAGLAALLVS